MNYCVITFRSVTPAQRGEGVIRRAGIRCTIRRTPGWMETRGCGYSLQVNCDSVKEAVELLKIAGIHYQKVYKYQDKDHVEDLGL